MGLDEVAEESADRVCLGLQELLGEVVAALGGFTWLALRVARLGVGFFAAVGDVLLALAFQQPVRQVGGGVVVVAVVVADALEDGRPPASGSSGSYR